MFSDFIMKQGISPVGWLSGSMFGNSIYNKVHGAHSLEITINRSASKYAPCGFFDTLPFPFAISHPVIIDDAGCGLVYTSNCTYTPYGWSQSKPQPLLTRQGEMVSG